MRGILCLYLVVMLSPARAPARAQKGKKKRFINDGVIRDFFVGLVLSVFCLVAIISVRTFLKLRPKPFCSDTLLQNCVKCPPHAVCRGNVVECVDGFVSSFGFCVKKDNLSKVAGQSIAAVRKELGRRAGAYICGSEDRDWISRDQVELIVLKNSGDNFGGVLNATIEFLMSDANVEVRPFSETVLFVGLNPQRSVLCVLSELVMENLIVMFAIAVVFLGVMYRRYRMWQRRSLENASFPLFRALFELIRKRRGNEISETQLKAKLQSLTKDAEELWPILAGQLHRSPRISTRAIGSERYYRICS